MIWRPSTACARPIRRALLWLLTLAILPDAALAQVAGDSVAPITRSVGVEYEYVHFDGELEPWQLASLSLRQSAPLGSLIGRVNYADRYGDTGVQMEMDAYPRFSRSSYAYLNAGYAPSGFFPTWRFGAELYGTFAGGWEGSAGMRRLDFEDASATILTGSVGRYMGNYWISARPYVDLDGGASGSLIARRYFADADHFVGASVGYGDTPSEDATPEELLRLRSFSAGVQGSTGVSDRLLGIWSGGYEREELAPDRFRQRLRASLGLRLDW